MNFETSFSEDDGVLTMRFASDYRSGGGVSGLLTALEKLTPDQRERLRGVIQDCSEVLTADLKDTDGAMMAWLMNRLERLGPRHQPFKVCVVSTHPAMKERYERVKGHTFFPLHLVETVEEAWASITGQGLEPKR